MKLGYSINRSGKAPGPAAPSQSGFIPVDQAADDMGVTAILISQNGELVSPDPIPAGVEGAYRFGDPYLAESVVYILLCTSVASQQLGAAEPETGPTGDVFSGSVRCGKVIYTGAVSALSESFTSQGVKKITVDFRLIDNISTGLSNILPRDIMFVHANVTCLDIADLANSDLVLYPDTTYADPSDPSKVKTWTCGISEAPATVTSSQVGFDDGAGTKANWFATIFTPGFLQPDPLTMNILGTAIGIYPDAEGSAKYNLTTPITRPIAVTFPDKVFIWPCIGYSKEYHRAGVYLAKLSDPMRVLAIAEGVCGIMVGPIIVG